MRKDTYDFETKQVYHAKLCEFILQQFPDGKRRRSLKVACLPGHEGLEITRVYDSLGIRRDRIWGIEHNPDTYKKIKSLDLGINLHPTSARSFFDQPGEQFDIINLDFQSQLKDEEALTVSTLFQQGRASPRCILGTNFYGSRESEVRLDHYQKSITYFTGGGTVRSFLENNQELNNGIDDQMDFNMFTEDRVVLDDVRDKMISLELRYLTSADKIDESLKSLEAFASRKFIDTLAIKANYPHNFLELSKNPKEHAEFILTADGLLRTGLMQILSSEFKNNDGLRNSLYLFTEIAHIQRPRFISKFHKGRYVSDNGSPMFFDFLLLNSRPDIFKDMHIQIGLDGVAPNQLIFHEGYKTRDISQGVDVLRIGDGIATTLGNSRLIENHPSLEEVLKYSGIYLIGDRNRFEQRIGEFSELVLKENDYVQAERETIQIKSLGEKVREDLSRGKQEAEILNKYHLTTFELAGHKATLSRQNGTSQDTVSNLYQPTDVEEGQIIEFLENGCASDEQIITSYGISKMQLAARKAHLTRKRNALNQEVSA